MIHDHNATTIHQITSKVLNRGSRASVLLTAPAGRSCTQHTRGWLITVFVFQTPDVQRYVAKAELGIGADLGCSGQMSCSLPSGLLGVVGPSGTNGQDPAIHRRVIGSCGEHGVDWTLVVGPELHVPDLSFQRRSGVALDSTTSTNMGSERLGWYR